MRQAIPLLALLAAGCANETTGPSSVAQGSVTWLEWPASVTTAAPGRIRVVGPDNNCGGVALGVSARPQRLTVSAEFFDSPPCRYLALDGVVATSYDTILPLPALSAPPEGLPAYYVVEAPIADRRFGDVLTHSLGFLQLGTAPDTTTLVAGRATLIADSAGCAWVRPEAWGLSRPPLSVVANPPGLGSATQESAFIGGRFVPASPARCGQGSVLHLDFAEVDATLP
jgi:hypothetical protein